METVEDKRIWSIVKNDVFKPAAAIAAALAVVGGVLCEYPSNNVAPEAPAVTTSAQQSPALYP